MTPPEYADYEEIRRLMARYNICGDRGDLSGLAATFSEDGVLMSGGTVSHGPAGILGTLRASGDARGSALTVVRHHLSTSLVELEEDGRARGRSYFTVFTDIGPDHSGVYVDRFVRTALGWRISKREVRIDWQSETSLFAPLPVRIHAAK